MGALEREVLAELWTLENPTTPAAVLQALGTNLAYTTVTTILTRLWRKGLVTREEHGRGYAYAPTLTEAKVPALAFSFVPRFEAAHAAQRLTQIPRSGIHSL